DGKPMACHLITDLKTGSTEYGVLKMAMQLAIYAHGEFYDHKTREREPLPEDINREWGLIINLPAGSGQCRVSWIPLTVGWRAVQAAGDVRELRSMSKKLLTPFNPFATVTEV